MIPFEYQSEDGISKTGRIELWSTDLPLEASIQANGWDFHVIIGEHSFGRYICIPNWDAGSELASLDDYFWNRERLSSHTKLGKTNAMIIATALSVINNVL